MSEFSPRKNTYLGTEYTKPGVTVSQKGLSLYESSDAARALIDDLRGLDMRDFRDFQNGSFGSHAVAANNRTGAALFRHETTGLFIKFHPSEADARQQFEAMNVLAERLKDDETLSAVNHYAVVKGASQVISVIEAAQGTQLTTFVTRDGYHNVQERKEIVETVKGETRRSLGRAGAALELDYDLGGSGNIFIDESASGERTYTIIDQPGPRRALKGIMAKKALHSLRLEQ